jgi:hypothetical protein
LKHLKLELKIDGLEKKVRVLEQTNRCNDFGDGYEFKASNGFCLRSAAMPEFQNTKLFFVRGHAEQHDNVFCDVPTDKALEELKVAVREYNEKFSVETEIIE